MEEDKEYWSLPEETKEQMIDKISALTWGIRGDWNDSRGECREIIRLCDKLRELK